MPLIICMMFFAALFSCEALWFMSASAREASELRRYQSVEHPRRATSDCYIDQFC